MLVKPANESQTRDLFVRYIKASFEFFTRNDGSKNTNRRQLSAEENHTHAHTYMFSLQVVQLVKVRCPNNAAIVDTDGEVERFLRKLCHALVESFLRSRLVPIFRVYFTGDYDPSEL